MTPRSASSAEGGRVRRVVLEQELKREYQAFLQAPNRGRRDGRGTAAARCDEIARWAEQHQLPIVDGHVQFPDVRIEYETPDGRREVRDVEVMTPHYRGAHAAAKVAAGFARYGAVGARLSGAPGLEPWRPGQGVPPRRGDAAVTFDAARRGGQPLTGSRTGRPGSW